MMPVEKFIPHSNILYEQDNQLRYLNIPKNKKRYLTLGNVFISYIMGCPIRAFNPDHISNLMMSCGVLWVASIKEAPNIYKSLSLSNGAMTKSDAAMSKEQNRFLTLPKSLISQTLVFTKSFTIGKPYYSSEDNSKAVDKSAIDKSFSPNS